MDTWQIIAVVVVAAVVLALAFLGAKRGQRGGLGTPRIGAGAYRDDLARNAGVASFGLNLPWRRPRGDSRRHRAR